MGHYRRAAVGNRGSVTKHLAPGGDADRWYTEGVIPLDTSPEAHEIQVEIHRRLGPVRRLEICRELSARARALHEAGYRARHPEQTDCEVLRGLVRERYGIELPDWVGATFRGNRMPRGSDGRRD
ncbi:MAG: hypothetical protein U0821_15910 [Chloroflexota bacterium]